MTKKLFKQCLLLFFTLLAAVSAHAQKVHSFGIYTGIAVPYTWDNGISQDPRYRTRFDIKYSPIGFHYGLDKEGHGFTLDASLIRIGQNFNVLNTNSGEIGRREIDLTYVQIPVGIKLHLVDMSFFKVSFVGSVGVGVLLNGKETISHADGEELKFPLAMTGSTVDSDQTKRQQFEANNSGYFVVPNGVLVNTGQHVRRTMLTNNDFQKFQLFGALGLRSDWDFSDKWRASFDLRANIGILEPRKSDYLDRAKNYEELYDMYGARRDLFLSLTFGFARTFTIERREEQKKSNKRQEFKPHRTKKYPWPKPRNKKPRG
jgi:hypothetical protein